MLPTAVHPTTGPHWTWKSLRACCHRCERFVKLCLVIFMGKIKIYTAGITQSVVSLLYVMLQICHSWWSTVQRIEKLFFLLNRHTKLTWSKTHHFYSIIYYLMHWNDLNSSVVSLSEINSAFNTLVQWWPLLNWAQVQIIWACVYWPKVTEKSYY